MRQSCGTLAILAMVVLACCCRYPPPKPTASTEFPEPVPRQSPPDLSLPYVHIDPAKRFVELETSVIRQVTREGEWLELLACTKGAKEHESILRTEARPGHVHFALLLVGLEPGSPMRWKIENNKVKIMHLPRGDRVRVTARYKLGDQSIDLPVHQWIRNQKTNEPLADNIWLFAGSNFETIEDRQVYMADLDGLVLSLVNFGDELLAPPTTLTRLNDEKAWVTVADKVPPIGTKVTLRLTPVADKNAAAKNGY